MNDKSSDNAGGGLRGLRARPSVALLKTVYDAYGISGISGSIDLGGSANLNLLVSDAHGRYVVRVYRPYVNEARLADIQLARQELNARGIPTSVIRSTLDGRQHIEFVGRLVEVERYAESDASMDSWQRLMEGLPLLGRMHAVLREVRFGSEGSKNPVFANYIEPQVAYERTLQGTRRIRGWNPSLYNQRLADAAEELARLVTTAERELIPMLPRQLVHGDYWDNNVRFRDGRIVLVSDFDFMGERARIDDLALTLYYFDCSGEPMSGRRLGRIRSLVDAYDEGLSEHLSVTERMALPLAMARQPLWSMGGWIALLDDEEAARRHASSMLREIEWALNILREVERWQSAFS